MRWFVLVNVLFLSSAWATTPPERPSPVNNECVQAYPFVAGHAPSEDIVDPGTGIVTCNGLVLPTSLVGYYVELDSWKDLAVVELESQPTFWSKWGERLEWVGVGIAVGVVAGVVVSRAEP